jgi:SH3-like domain-containing protein
MEGKRTVVYAPTDSSQGTSVTVTQDEDGTTRITLVCQGK